MPGAGGNRCGQTSCQARVFGNLRRRLRAQGSQTQSQSRSHCMSGCIEIALLCSHVGVPTWKEISRARHVREAALISKLWSSRWGTQYCLLCPESYTGRLCLRSSESCSWVVRALKGSHAAGRCCQLSLFTTVGGGGAHHHDRLLLSKA